MDLEKGNINTKEYWNINYSNGFYQDNSFAEWQYTHDFIKRVLPSTPCRILEVGCGLAHNSRYAADFGHSIIATDFSEVAIKESSRRFPHPKIRYECFSIKEAAGVFKNNDVVMAFEILEHFIEPLFPMLDICRSLKDGGLLIFSVPNNTGKFAEWCQHYIIFDYKNLTELLFKAGFSQVIFYKDMFNKERIFGAAVR